MDNPRLRASDADRNRAAELLQEHFGAGRLSIDELQERLAAAFAAKTIGELDELMADLPAIDLHQPPDRVVAPRPSSLAKRPTADALAKVAPLAVVIGLYAVSGLVLHLWWIPWWLIFLIVASRMGQRSNRSR